MANFLFMLPEIFLPPLEKYHDVYQNIGFNWVWFAFSTHFWDLQTQSNKGFHTFQLSPSQLAKLRR